MSTRRVVDWQIKPGDDDNHDLYLHNRRVLHDMSITEITKYLRQRRQPSETVHQIASDGYITDRTDEIERRQPNLRRRPLPKSRVPVRMPLIKF